MKLANNRLFEFSLCVVLLLIIVRSALAQGTAFTYQGTLMDGGNPANGNYDVQFKLFDTLTVGTGTQVGATITNLEVSRRSGEGARSKI